MDATMGSQMGYFFFDPKTQMQMNFHGLPMSPLYSRPTSACSPQAPTLYSNAPAMSMGPMKPNMMLDTDFCNTLTLSGSALNSPAVDMLNANPMFSGIDTTEWVSGVSPPHTPSGFIQQSSTPSFTSCPSLSPSPSPVDTTEFLDPRNLTVSASDLISTNDDIFKTEPEDSTSIEAFDFNPSVPGMNFELENIDFNFDLPASLPSMSTTTTTTRPRASTGSSVVSLGLFESPDFQIAESAFDLINELEEPATKRARTSPEPVATSAPSPAATEVISPTSPATASATPSIPSAPVAVPEASFSASTTAAAAPIPAPASRRGRKQSLTEDPSKTFVCDLCNRRFRRQEHLKRHYRSLHTQEKPFECTDCGKKFSRSDNLAQHARTHGSGAIVMDLIDNHGYEPMLAGMAHAPTGDFSAYGKVLFQMPPEMMQAAVGGDEGKKKRKRSD